MSIAAVLFDFDGTLTEPGKLDFEAIRREIGSPPGVPILEFLERLDDPPAANRARAILHRHEMAAAAVACANRDAAEVLEHIRAAGLPCGIVTRNSRRAVRQSLAGCIGFDASDFAIVLTRDDQLPPKPDPAPLQWAAERLGCPADQVLFVGDHHFDVAAGRAAGCLTVFLQHPGQPMPTAPAPDRVIGRLREVLPIIDRHRALPVGKLPETELRALLRALPKPDALLVGPAMGEDCAVIRLTDELALVATTDPITFTTDRLSRYVVQVNANDVATTGATPQWLLTTVLLPPGMAAAEARELVSDIARVAAAAGICLCGGHTEVTDAVTRAVVVGQMFGVAAPGALLNKDALAPGHQVVLTKRVAVEGTAIIATEHRELLRKAGLPESVIQRSRRFLEDPGISVLKEARLAVDSGAAVAMHDVTEGGLATAVRELSAAGNCRVRIWPERIPVYPETRQLCEPFSIDPLGLIGSGSLLIAARPERVNAMLTRLRGAGVEATVIGKAVAGPAGVEAVGPNGDSAWPVFPVDEITKVGAARAVS